MTVRSLPHLGHVRIRSEACPKGHYHVNNWGGMIKPSLRTAEIGCVRPMLGCIMETTMWRALILVAAADMSAFENYQPHALALQKAMSALPPIATAKADMPQIAVSAFPPTADMCNATSNVGYGPIADICRLFGHLVGARE